MAIKSNAIELCMSTCRFVSAMINGGKEYLEMFIVKHKAYVEYRNRPGDKNYAKNILKLALLSFFVSKLLDISI